MVLGPAASSSVSFWLAQSRAVAGPNGQVWLPSRFKVFESGGSTYSASEVALPRTSTNITDEVALVVDTGPAGPVGPMGTFSGGPCRCEPCGPCIRCSVVTQTKLRPATPAMALRVMLI